MHGAQLCGGAVDDDGSPGRGRRRLARGVGRALLGGGLAVLTWFAWQVWGTNWQSQQEHREIVEALEEEWTADRAGGEVAGRPADEVVGLVRIPRFGADHVVPLLDGIDDAALRAGLGHFSDSASPGGRGNFALAGHRVTRGEPLRRMPELRPGDEVVVETADAVHTYVLDTGGSDLEVPFTETWVLDRLPVNPRRNGVQPPSLEPGSRLITLTTCAELFHTDQRLVAFGHLERTVRK